jgi:hypothetical protein
MITKRNDRIHRSTALVWLGFVLAASATLSAAEMEEGFVSMFNGKDLTGWQGAPGWWEVRDGAIVAESSSEKPSDRTHYLYWKGGEPGRFRAALSLPYHGKGRQLGDSVP